MSGDNVVRLGDTAENPTENEKTDSLFAERGDIADFHFDRSVAKVFDDMVGRSVPFYDEIQRMTGELARDFATPNTTLYDIGCATATTLLAVDPLVDPSVRFVGIDNSADMLEKAREKVRQSKTARVVDFVVADLNEGMQIDNASVIAMILTLQFVRPLYRQKVMQNVFNGLNPGGCLILVEKLTCESTVFNRLFIDKYYDFKRRNGYSEVEIARKREALENVLIPYRVDENIELLKSAGFKRIEVFFRWYNFCGLVAVK